MSDGFLPCRLQERVIYLRKHTSESQDRLNERTDRLNVVTLYCYAINVFLLPISYSSLYLMMPFYSFCRHSPFRQHKTKDKHEIDRMTMTMVSRMLVVRQSKNM